MNEICSFIKVLLRFIREGITLYLNRNRPFSLFNGLLYFLETNCLTEFEKEKSNFRNIHIFEMESKIGVVEMVILLGLLVGASCLEYPYQLEVTRKAWAYDCNHF